MNYVREFKNLTPGELITSVQLMFNLPNCYIKAAILYFNLWRLEKAKEMLDDMDKSCTRQEEKLQVHRYVIRCNKIYLAFMSVYNFYPLSTFATAIINGVTPWSLYIPFLNWRDGTQQLWLAAIIEYILVIFPVYYNNATDIYPVIYGQTIRSHFDLLIKRIQRLRCDEDKSEDKNYEELTGCIKDHKRILEYCDILRPLISSTIFFQFLVVGMTFPFCYTCNLLDEDVDRLTLSIFQSNWLSASRRYKISLIYFLHKAQQPLKFTAGSIFEISLRTNISLAKFAFSVVTLVQKFNLAAKMERK
ncbi:odorant receptor 42b-like [Drosophila albomicans]|uniref:Odorant receptor 42b-like n=1 Tax=Drosophila albomicans TaxID=7291 RepID=A0A6P8XD51_DROAB|nr:odorant receptor 42b-like [Drosophila albomicans]